MGARLFPVHGLSRHGRRRTVREMDEAEAPALAGARFSDHRRVQHLHRQFAKLGFVSALLIRSLQAKPRQGPSAAQHHEGKLRTGFVHQVRKGAASRAAPLAHHPVNSELQTRLT